MRKFLFISCSLLLMCALNVSFGADNPTSKHRSESCNFEQLTNVHSLQAVNAYYFVPVELSEDRFIASSNVSISKSNTGATLHYATADHPLRLCRWDNKFKVNERIHYKPPFVDRRYIWENEHQFNC